MFDSDDWHRAPLYYSVYQDDREWRLVEANGTVGVLRHTWNTLTFAPLTTTALRIEVVRQPGFSAGVQEWKVK